MMRRSIIVALLVVVFSAYGVERPSFSTKDVLNAIAAFRGDPLSDLGRLGGGVVMAYVKTSPDVMVRLTPKVFPIFGKNNHLSDDEFATLLVAYDAGNAGSQLKRNKIGDDAYAGDLQLIETYKLLQRRNPKLKVTGIEKLIELDRSDRLKQYVSSL